MRNGKSNLSQNLPSKSKPYICIKAKCDEFDECFVAQLQVHSVQNKSSRHWLVHLSFIIGYVYLFIKELKKDFWESTSPICAANQLDIKVGWIYTYYIFTYWWSVNRIRVGKSVGYLFYSNNFLFRKNKKIKINLYFEGKFCFKGNSLEWDLALKETLLSILKQCIQYLSTSEHKRKLRKCL